MSENTKEILRKMALLSISNNQINEVHLKNLKMFPLVFFNGVKSAQIEYDLTNHSKVEYETDAKTANITYKFQKPKTDNFKILYELEIDESADNSSLDKRFAALEMSISNLLWKGIPIEVKFNGKEVYKSKKDEPAKNS